MMNFIRVSDLFVYMSCVMSCTRIHRRKEVLRNVASAGSHDPTFIC